MGCFREKRPRFKIDYNRYGSASYPVALYAWKKGFFAIGVWDLIESFKTSSETRERYARLKDLPEYLP